MRIIDVSVPPASGVPAGTAMSRSPSNMPAIAKERESWRAPARAWSQSTSPIAEDAGMQIGIPIYGRAGCTGSRS